MSAPPFTLRQLEIFIAVARTRNITRAAELLHLSPSAISAAITELERAVAASLCIRRKGRGVQLTSEGRIFEQLAVRLVEEAQEIQNAIADYTSGTIHGTLRLGSYSPLSASFLPSLMRDFTAKYPAVEIELLEGLESRLHEMLLDGLVDIALGYERPAHPQLESIHLASRRPHVLVAKDHHFASRGHISLSDIVDEHLILLDIGVSKARLMSWFTELDLTPSVRWVTHDIDLTRALVGHGLGYAVLMQRQRHNLTVDGQEVHTLELEPCPTPNDVYLVVARTAKRTKRVQALVEFALQTCRDLPAWTGVIPGHSSPVAVQ